MDSLFTYLPSDIRQSIAAIGGPKAAWAQFDNNSAAASHREFAVIAGEGPGRVIGVRIVEIAGKTVKQWLEHERADQHDPQRPDWRTGAIPARLHEPFVHLKQILRHPKLPELKPSHLLHKSSILAA